MNQNRINIISFDIPYPADYGGIIDIYFKIKTLYEADYEIILHCFQYVRPIAPILNDYCKKVIYYKRKKGIQYILSHRPYIVVTRENKKLLHNLKKNDYPILFEGLHTCSFISHPDLQNRRKIIRMHNVEHQYYHELAEATSHPAKKLFYKLESKKLIKFEQIISHAFCILAISGNDCKYFSGRHANVLEIPAFHPLKEVVSKIGKGDYFLYHGNLAVEENEKAVLFLIEKVFSKIDSKLIITGKSPSSKVKQTIKQHNNVELIPNPEDKAISVLIANAHCCVLPTFQKTGLKLKLLISLFKSRHVIVNKEMVENTGLESLCIIAQNGDDFIQKIEEIKNIDFSGDDIKNRKEVLKKFSNKNNVKRLIESFTT
ncbi:glycosyltransferase family 4 protein [Draconibacterium sp.]|nr:glycosyltransferase family 4 protein [Draconibacterium sp.]